MSLDFHREIFSNLLDDDGILVMAQGLGVHKVLLNFLRLHCDPSSLVLVLGVSRVEQKTIHDELRILAVPVLPHTIDAEYTAQERLNLYTSGGVLFGSPRILVVDFLTKRIPVHLITGIVVANCHKITETSSESFVVRLYRQANKVGFIKGFSDWPEGFTRDYGQTERIMRLMYAKQLLLWPRFHASVTATLAKHTPDLVELKQPVTDSMATLQKAVFEIMDTCLKELKLTNQIDVAELTTENGMFASFDTRIRQQLDAVWHQTGFRTKQLVSDLRFLRRLLTYLIRYDCVTYLRYVETLRINEFSQNSPWIFLDAANTFFTVAKSRVYLTDKKRNKEGESNVELVLEANPKWGLLVSILDEIDAENVDGGSTGDAGRVLIAVRDERTCTQLQEYLELGESTMLLKQWEKYKASPVQRTQAYGQNNNLPEDLQNRWKGGPYKKQWGSGRGKKTETNFPIPRPKPGRGRGKGGKGAAKGGSKGEKGGGKGEKGKGKGKAGPGSVTVMDINPINLDSDYVTVADVIKDDEEEEFDLIASAHKKKPKQKENEELLIDFNEHYGLVPPPYIIIHPITGTVLDEVRPKYIIAYDSDLAFTRQIEVYKAENAGTPLRVYWMYYENSIESQKFQIAAERETKAFERLIHEKSIMVIGSNQDGKQDIPQPSPSRQTVVAGSARRGGRPLITTSKKKVAVDMREFRSALPCVLHSRGYDIHPVTLSVGDYLLTPTLCVERKSVTDLFQSLNTGHLYQQTEALCRQYQNPVLLIEFDGDKAFSLQHVNEISHEISQSNVISKLVLLTTHFPRLRLFWCRSPHATAELFEVVKDNQEDPDPQKANEEAGTHSEANMALDILRKMPGITESNYRNVMENVENIYELSQMGLDELTKLLYGKANAQKLFHFFHHSI
eukprot:Phypoly_transcript_02199.p1 GENE.Phypoly_transcript_02199~~Phypoly_transcript_02199.p1  ORF type:complete len:903 (+),score=131.34 Phypoly_transcript_02199:173-2881(+)